MFVSEGCSYSYGASLYYHKWLADKPKDFKIPQNHDSWPVHHEFISSGDDDFRRKNRFVDLIADELNTEYYGAQELGGSNHQIIEQSQMSIKRSKSLQKDNVKEGRIDFLLIQLTHGIRDYNKPSAEEIYKWYDNQTIDDHYEAHLNKTIDKLNELWSECLKNDIKLYVFSMDIELGEKIINKDYFIPIYFDGVEYNSIQDLVMTKNGININGVSVWKMGKNINVPIYVCDELHRFGVVDTHLGLNGNKIVKDSVIRKIKG